MMARLTLDLLKAANAPKICRACGRGELTPEKLLQENAIVQSAADILRGFLTERNRRKMGVDHIRPQVLAQRDAQGQPFIVVGGSLSDMRIRYFSSTFKPLWLSR